MTSVRNDSHTTPAEGSAAVTARPAPEVPDHELLGVHPNVGGMSEQEWRNCQLRMMARVARSADRAERKAETAAATAVASALEIVRPLSRLTKDLQAGLRKLTAAQSETNAQVATLRADVMGYELHRATDVVEREAIGAQLREATEDAERAKRRAVEAASPATAANKPKDDDDLNEVTGRYALSFLQKAAETALATPEKKHAIEAELEKERIRARRATIVAIVGLAGTIIAALVALIAKG